MAFCLFIPFFSPQVATKCKRHVIESMTECTCFFK